MVVLLILLVFVGTFLAAAVAVFVIAAIQAKRNAMLDPEETGAGEDGYVPLLLRQEPVSSLPFWQQLLERLNFTARLKRQIEEAGLRWSVGRVSLAMLLLAALAFALFFDASWAPPGTAFVAAWLGGSIPYWIIRKKRAQRISKMESQFPDALDSLARAMRAGHALSGAIAMLAVETPAPLCSEFRKIADEQRLGLDWSQVLANFSERLPILEVRLFVAAVMVQVRTGGKLTEVLERLSETIRESAALRGEVRSLSAQGRLTGTILTALPIFIALAMMYTNPGYIGLLFADPRGKYLVWAAGACLIAGHFVIGRIVDIKAPQ
jgi:tight adherence protein B